MLDENLILKHLDLFVKTFCRRSKDYTSFDLDCLLVEEEKWDSPKFRHGDLPWTNPKKYLERYEKKGVRKEKRHYAPRDPMNVPELRRLLDHPEKIRGRKRTPPKKSEKAKENPEKQIKRSHRMSLHASYSFDTRSIIVTTEIILLIMDCCLSFEISKLYCGCFRNGEAGFLRDTGG